MTETLMMCWLFKVKLLRPIKVIIIWSVFKKQKQKALYGRQGKFVCQFWESFSIFWKNQKVLNCFLFKKSLSYVEMPLKMKRFYEMESLTEHVYVKNSNFWLWVIIRWSFTNKKRTIRELIDWRIIIFTLLGNRSEWWKEDIQSSEWHVRSCLVGHYCILRDNAGNEGGLEITWNVIKVCIWL